jgi:hypothetical protein
VITVIGKGMTFMHIADGYFKVTVPHAPASVVNRLWKNARRRAKTHQAAQEIVERKIREWRRYELNDSEPMQWLRQQCHFYVWDADEYHYWAEHIIHVGKRDIAALFKLTFCEGRAA